jgi:RNA polymerase sigma-70 factor (TIGR02957 family)
MRLWLHRGVTDLAELHDELRPLMFSIAYRMLGSVAEAEDVVQDAFLRLHTTTTAGTRLDSPEAFATTVTTRLAIDALRSARVKREQYVGSWLPEPLLADSEADPSWRIEMDETVSIAFLSVLERLSPLERAVFVLREVFDYGYGDIAAVIERSEQTCRQLMSRARRHLAQADTRREDSAAQRDELASRFFAALRQGDVAGLERLLVADAVFYGDGGGKAPAISHPIQGRGQVVRFILGLLRRGAELDARTEPAEANGMPALRLVNASGELLGVMAVEVVDGHVRSVLNQINPDKLRHLGRVGDLTALMRGEA